MIINNFQTFSGEHCETTATGTLLANLGIELSEPMLFGIGEGLGYIIWNMKIMDFPFIGGRIKPDLITRNITGRLNLKLEVKETTSVKKAWHNVSEKIDKGIPVGLKLDCFHLEYFAEKIHFAGHYVTIYGYDGRYAYLIDTAQQGYEVKTTLASLQMARNERGPMSSKNLSYTIQRRGALPELKTIIPEAIVKNAEDYLNPPIKNMGYKGIAKTSREIKKWFATTSTQERDFTMTAMLMEKAGTGGSLFRNLYRNFLKESYELLQLDELQQGYISFHEIAGL